MAEKGYYYETNENGKVVVVDKKTGKRELLDELISRAAESGHLKTMEQQMADEHKKNVDEIEEV